MQCPRYKNKLGVVGLAFILSACGGSSSNSSSSSNEQNASVIASTTISTSNSSTTGETIATTNNATSTSGMSTTPVATTEPAIPSRITNARGALLQDTFLSQDSLNDLTQAIADARTKAPPLLPIYAVKNYRLTYLTLNGQGELVQASGLIALPQKPSGFKSPLLSFQHGTIFYNKQAPSNQLDITDNPSHIFASLGYIVVAADYVGYGVSTAQKHPYLQAIPSATAVADLITAAKQWLAEQRISTNNQLFLTGYSEGGYVTLATHKALQDAGQAVTATIAGAGPYDLRRTLDILFSTDTVKKALASLIGLKSATTAARYPGLLDETIVNIVMNILIPQDSDIKFDKTFLLDYMADDYATLIKNSVYNWKANAPIKLTHGREDETVPFENASLALDTMHNLGNKVELEECLAKPSTHSNCIKPYVESMTNYFSSLAQDL